MGLLGLMVTGEAWAFRHHRVQAILDSFLIPTGFPSHQAMAARSSIIQFHATRREIELVIAHVIKVTNAQAAFATRSSGTWKLHLLEDQQQLQRIPEDEPWSMLFNLPGSGSSPQRQQSEVHFETSCSLKLVPGYRNRHGLSQSSMACNVDEEAAKVWSLILESMRRAMMTGVSIAGKPGEDAISYRQFRFTSGALAEYQRGVPMLSHHQVSEGVPVDPNWSGFTLEPKRRVEFELS